MPDSPAPQTIAESIWITLTDRQKELLFWQVVTDLGGEVSTIPADDVPGRRLLFHNDGVHGIGMCATDGFDDAGISREFEIDVRKVETR